MKNRRWRKEPRSQPQRTCQMISVGAAWVDVLRVQTGRPHENMGPMILCIDLGKTSCRASGGGRRAEGVGAPGLAAPGGVRAAEGAILALASQLASQLRPVEELIVGAAGALTAPGAARALGRGAAGLAAGGAGRGDK